VSRDCDRMFGTLKLNPVGLGGGGGTRFGGDLAAEGLHMGHTMATRWGPVFKQPDEQYPNGRLMFEGLGNQDAPAPTIPGEEAITNGGFEDGNTDWDAEVGAWGNELVIGAPAFAGAAGLHISCEEGGGRVSQSITLRKQSRYYLTAQVGTSGPVAGGTFRIGITSLPACFLEIPTGELAAGYAQVSLSFVHDNPADAVVDFVIEATGTNSPGEVVNVDTVSLYKKTEENREVVRGWPVATRGFRCCGSRA
jgi:hypothetical protein